MKSRFQGLENISEEQLPIAKHKLHDWTHFMVLYAGELSRLLSL